MTTISEKIRTSRITSSKDRLIERFNVSFRLKRWRSPIRNRLMRRIGMDVDGRESMYYAVITKRQTDGWYEIDILGNGLKPIYFDNGASYTWSKDRAERLLLRLLSRQLEESVSRITEFVHHNQPHGTIVFTVESVEEMRDDWKRLSGTVINGDYTGYYTLEVPPDAYAVGEYTTKAT